jgi:LacI family transcriptional regulator
VGYASPQVRQRVRAAAEALNYHPNAIAQSLRRQRSVMIGHVVPSIYPNLFYACIASGVEQRASAAGFPTVTCNTHHSAQAERNYVELLLRQRAAGIIFTTPVREDNVLFARDNGVAVCVVERPQELGAVDVILGDNRGGVRTAVAHLLGLGHERVAFVGAPPDNMSDNERFAGYCEALEAQGLTTYDGWIRFAGHARDAGYRAMCDLLALPDRPTAAFCAGDLSAIGALQALWEHRMRVPDDFSLISMDDTLAEATCPPLTALAIPMAEMGATAVDLVLRREESESGGPAQTVVLPMQLVVRASCRAVAHSRAT